MKLRPRSFTSKNQIAHRARARHRRSLIFEPMEQRTLLANAVAPMTLGMNLNQLNYYSTAPMFVDVMKDTNNGWLVVKQSSLESPWSISGVQEPPMDANGYPIGLGNLPSQGYALSTAAFTQNGENYPTGTYTLIFDGGGTVVVHQGNNTTTVSQPGGLGQPHAVKIVANGNGIAISITQSNASDYVRNIQLIMPGYQNTYETQPFYQPYLQGLESFNILRFKDAMDTDFQTIENWSQRTTATYRTQTASTGMAVEYMVDLANTLHEDMWVNMPVMAQPDYVQGFAQYVLANLDPGLKVYVEYGNEDWNWGYTTGYQYILNYAKANGISEDQATADLAVNDWNIWESVWGNQDSRVERVVANQFSVPSRLNAEIQQIVADSPNDPDHGFEVVSGAPYFAPSTSSYTASTTVQKIESDSMAAVSALGPQLSAFMAVDKSWEAQLGQNIPVIMYEGGWALEAPLTAPWYNAYVAAETDPGMSAVTTAFLDELNSYGVNGLLYYSYVSEPNQWGEWGSMESLFQPSSQTPKFDALQAYSLTVPPTISDVTVSSRTATGATISWTTAEPSTSQVDYGVTSAYGEATTVDPTLDTVHTVTLTGLALNTVYHFSVESARANGLNDTSADMTFSTDVTPPADSELIPTSVTATSVTISWITDKPTYGYITTTAGGSTLSASDPTLTTSHSITLSGLSPNTVYTYTATSTDTAGNVFTSSPSTIQTAAASAVSLLGGPSPTALGSTATAGTPSAIATQGQYAYVVSSTAPYNLQVYNTGRGGAPVLVATVATNAAYPAAVAVSGNYAYILSIFSNSLLIYNISNPASPKFVGTTNVGMHPYSIAIEGSYAYIANYPGSAGASTLSIYNISNPAKVTFVGSAATSPLSKFVTVNGRYAYVTGDGNPNFQIFDVSNPSAPVLVTPGRPLTGLTRKARWLRAATPT